MQYDVDYFIRKFEAVVTEKMIPFHQDDGRGNHCALGWCNTKMGYNNNEGKEYKALSVLFGDQWRVAAINNGLDPDYRQPTPKQRILAALHDIKKLNQGTGTSTERRNEVQSELQRADITKKLSQIETVPETSDLITVAVDK